MFNNFQCIRDILFSIKLFWTPRFSALITSFLGFEIDWFVKKIVTDDFMSEIGAVKLNLSKKQHLSNKMNEWKSNFEKTKGIQLLAQETERDWFSLQIPLVSMTYMKITAKRNHWVNYNFAFFAPDDNLFSNWVWLLTMEFQKKLFVFSTSLLFALIIFEWVLNDLVDCWNHKLSLKMWGGRFFSDLESRLVNPISFSGKCRISKYKLTVCLPIKPV